MPLQKTLDVVLDVCIMLFHQAAHQGLSYHIFWSTIEHGLERLSIRPSLRGLCSAPGPRASPGPPCPPGRPPPVGRATPYFPATQDIVQVC